MALVDELKKRHIQIPPINTNIQNSMKRKIRNIARIILDSHRKDDYKFVKCVFCIRIFNEDVRIWTVFDNKVKPHRDETLI